MYLLIDNYDSFTYNVYQYIAECTNEPLEVVRNDRIGIDKIERMDPKAIIISPGPGRPEEAGVSVEIVRTFSAKKPILGICLGHQAIGYAYGAKIGRAKRIVHGKTEKISLDGKGLFRAIPDGAEFTRYHSLSIDPETVPDELEVTATSADGEIMGVRHKQYPVEGVQFHPESMASEYGKKVIRNFLNYRREPFSIRETLQKVLSGSDLSRKEAEGFMEELTDGNLSDAQIAGFLIALNIKGPTPEEIAGCAAVLRRKRIPITCSKPLLDIVGTGGDGLGTFNISSLAALTAASCGAVVAKHGNRAVSSVSGSADFYAKLGIPIDLSPKGAAELLEQTGFSFLFAPIYHSAMKYAAPARKELGVKTIMNLLGPLVNPAGAEYQVVGVFSEQFLRPVAEASSLLGVKRGMVIHASDGLDEITVTGPTRALLIEEDGMINEMTIDPTSFGIPSYPLRDLLGGSSEVNGELASDLLAGRGKPALLDIVSLNAAAGLLVYGAVSSLSEGFSMAKEAFRTGKVKKKVDEIIEAGNSLQ